MRLLCSSDVGPPIIAGEGRRRAQGEGGGCRGAAAGRAGAGADQPPRAGGECGGPSHVHCTPHCRHQVLQGRHISARSLVAKPSPLPGPDTQGPTHTGAGAGTSVVHACMHSQLQQCLHMHVHRRWPAAAAGSVNCSGERVLGTSRCRCRCRCWCTCGCRCRCRSVRNAH
jgi:hypothetical protein